MKRKVTITILTLVMCLTMAFPANALNLNSNLNADIELLIDTIKQKAPTLVPAGYNYSIFVSETAASKIVGNSVKVVAFYSNTPNISSGTRCYVLSSSSSNYSVVNRNGTNLYVTMVNPNLATYTDFIYLDVKDQNAYGRQMHIYGIYVDYNTAVFTNYNAWYETMLAKGTDIEWHLSPLVDATALTALISQAKAILDIGYTQASWNALQTRITAAESVIADTSKTQSQIDSALHSLQASIDSLTVAAPVDPDPPKPPKPPAPLGYDLSTGDVSGYLNVIPRIFYNYVLSAKEIYLGIFGIVLGILIIPRLLGVIFPRLKR